MSWAFDQADELREARAELSQVAGLIQAARKFLDFTYAAINMGATETPTAFTNEANMFEASLIPFERRLSPCPSETPKHSESPRLKGVE